MLKYSLKNIINNKICRANRISGLCFVIKASPNEVKDLLAGNIAELNGWKVHEQIVFDVKSIELEEEAKPASNAKYKFKYYGLGVVEANSYLEASKRTGLSTVSLASLAKSKKQEIKGWRAAA